MPRRQDDHCPHCNETFPAGRLACPHCGSDAETGWSEDGLTGYSTSLPEEFTDEDYEDVLRGIHEDLTGERPPMTGRQITMLVIALVTLAAFVLTFVF